MEMSKQTSSRKESLKDVTNKAMKYGSFSKRNFPQIHSDLLTKNGNNQIDVVFQSDHGNDVISSELPLQQWKDENSYKNMIMFMQAVICLRHTYYSIAFVFCIEFTILFIHYSTWNLLTIFFGFIALVLALDVMDFVCSRKIEIPAQFLSDEARYAIHVFIR